MIFFLFFLLFRFVFFCITLKYRLISHSENRNRKHSLYN